MPNSPLPPVLLVHGIGSSFEHNWQRTGWVDILGLDDRTAVGFELPGHGGSTTPLDGDAAVRELTEVVSGHGLVDAVGFSAGAMLLARVAVAVPEAFRRLALLGIGDRSWGAGEEGDSGALDLAAALESDTEDGDPRVRIFQRLARSAGNDPVRVAGYLRTAPSLPSPEQLAAVTCPTLIVVGERDAVGPADRLAAAFADARAVVLPGVDHMATTTDVRCQDRVSRFLAENG
ncbi:alpha/beta hydrolase [Blastococcus sp. CT_GayMR16]|uniref:alpha/beta fold hydrolase n=1 Tax=Blastococcus sp. CT_GayMR16 TaxID=2559607 RepID=UPI001074452D|nr:alpha/beta hydrolase [Blastococcus sp. CT_GayMR16]TFV88848.1 alpha/beta hydrolase [Blastococcus sp. CT_GayMR16]